ncbi:hypothetical protein Bra3105_17890 [Brachybacterium halotolerans subsp. kimchii]|uniref:helix-turn-helix domain-containing protein n=1 Tax=Brachybacterium halotolerans TaxID=2795215 RepID=UPI001E5C256E|nr:hypothetical protein [Brachybacterium halotolerans]UEJ82674.1 hypothetical protein Bra3105_17890 [Brachybacterium halotolerans subsp. kimchii]
MNALHPLGQLIQSVEDSRGWTLREIARRIDERAGRTISHAYVARLKKKPISSVTYETIHALAVGLDVPERLVGAAALETMGVRDLDQSEAGAAVAIARDPGLSERDRRILLAAVREMQDATDTQQHEPAPTSAFDVEDPAQPDGATSRRKPPHVRRPERRSGPGDEVVTPQELPAEMDGIEFPWQLEDFDLAAKRGRNRGREAREQQDRDAEDGGA